MKPETCMEDSKRALLESTNKTQTCTLTNCKTDLIQKKSALTIENFLCR